jgi:putative peptidoglycan lipid II flippase
MRSISARSGKGRFLAIIVSATGISILGQALAFVRQLLIAAYYGVSRDLDVYVVLYAIATITVFTFASIFDSVAVPRLVRVREAAGAEASRQLAVAMLRISVAVGAAASALLVLAVPLLAPIVATGFAQGEQAELGRLAWYFLPWTLVCLPYYALAAWHKAQWRFLRVFTAEIVVIAVSMGVLALWHSDIRLLPIAYGTGYLVGLVQLGVDPTLSPQNAERTTPPVGALLRNVGELYLANQSGGLATLVDRHVQSYIPAGGIAAVNYAAQIVNGLATLLTFREIFVVPLAQQTDRAERLERLVGGLVLAAVPLCGIVVCFAPELVKVLFERGRFGQAASELTGAVLRISALTLVITSINTPVARMFQIVDRINLTHVMYLALALALLLFGYLFVGVLGLGIRGVAWMQVASGAVVCIVNAHLLSRCGIHLRWRRVGGHAVFAAIASASASLLAILASSTMHSFWGALICGGITYVSVIGAFYYLARSRLHGIAFGMSATEHSSA